MKIGTCESHVENPTECVSESQRQSIRSNEIAQNLFLSPQDIYTSEKCMEFNHLS